MKQLAQYLACDEYTGSGMLVWLPQYVCTLFHSSFVRSEALSYLQLYFQPWLVWLICLSIIPCTKRSLVQFPIQTHAPCSGLDPQQGGCQRRLIYVSLSPPPSSLSNQLENPHIFCISNSSTACSGNLQKILCELSPYNHFPNPLALVYQVHMIFHFMLMFGHVTGTAVFL